MVRDCAIGSESEAWRLLETKAKCVVSRIDQYRSKNRLYQRLEFENADLANVHSHLEDEFNSSLVSMRVVDSSRKKRVAVFASRCDHALWEILLRQSVLGCEVPIVISNHEDLRFVAEACGARFEVFEINPSNKRRQEKREIELLKNENIDVVVLARYMQVLTAEFCQEFENRILNVHHSLLPSFPGANARARARLAGVKLIGATAHYATADLDAGPIIAQSAAPCSHAHSIADMREIGADLERAVLFDALRAHLEDRVFVHRDTTTIVF